MDVERLVRSGPMREQTQRLDRADTCIAMPKCIAKRFATLLVAIEEHVFLMWEMIEDRHAADVGGLCDLVHRHVVETALDEETRRSVGDALSRGKALPGPAIGRH